MTTICVSQPLAAAFFDKAAKIMDVIFHFGAHRTASTTFQHYMRSNSDTLKSRDVAFLGPLRTRSGGLFRGVLPQNGVTSIERAHTLARGRIAVQLEKSARKGVKKLVISDENALGSARQCLRDERLYGDAGNRMSLFHNAFGGRVTKLVLSIRALDTFWASTLAFAVSRGHKLPTTADLDRLVTQPSSWRDVITSVGETFPNVPLEVQCYETLAGLPERRLWHMTDGALTPPMRDAREWLNPAPDLADLRNIMAARGTPADATLCGDGRWMPFDDAQQSALRETYADDLFWLRAGAGGIATLTEELQPTTLGINPAGGAMTRGQNNDGQDASMARAG